MSLACPPCARTGHHARGIHLIGAYNSLRDKFGVVVLPIAGAFGDSVRAIIQRDLDFSDRFTSFRWKALIRALGVLPARRGIELSPFTQLAAAASSRSRRSDRLHVVLHDVGPHASEHREQPPGVRPQSRVAARGASRPMRSIGGHANAWNRRDPDRYCADSRFGSSTATRRRDHRPDRAGRAEPGMESAGTMLVQHIRPPARAC